MSVSVSSLSKRSSANCAFIESWTIIAKNLDDLSLKKLSDLSLDLREIALKEKSIRDLSKAEKDFNDLLQEDNPAESSGLNLLKVMVQQYCASELQDINQVQSVLTSIITHEIGRDLLRANYQLQIGIDEKNLDFDDIEKCCEKWKVIAIARAMNNLISSSKYSELSLNFFVKKAIESSQKDLLRELLHINHSQVSLGQAVIQAAEQSHQEILTDLLKQGSINIFSRGQAALAAAAKGSDEILKLLLKNGSIFIFDRELAVIQAANQGHLSTVELLLNGESIGHSERGRAVVNSISKGHHTIAQFLLKKGRLSSHALGKALRYAVESGSLELVKDVMQNGYILPADRNFAFFISIKKGHEAIAKELFDGGHGLTSQTQGEALVTAVNHGKLACVKMLVEQGSIQQEHKQQALQAASFSGSVEIIQSLLKKGTFSSQSLGFALRSASAHGFYLIAKELLKTTKIPNLDIAQALFGAARIGHKETLEILAAYADAHNLGSCLIFLASNHHLEALQMVLEKYDCEDKYISDALLAACRAGNQDIVECILKNGEITESIRGWAITEAASFQHENIALALLDDGPTTNHDREKARAYAREHHLNRLVQALDKPKKLVKKPYFLVLDAVKQTPGLFLDTLISDGFPSSIELIDAPRVFDSGGVRKGFVTNLFTSLHSTLGLSSEHLPSISSEQPGFEDKSNIFKKLGKVCSQLLLENRNNPEPFLIGPFFPIPFYKILKVIGHELSPYRQRLTLAEILKDKYPNYKVLADLILEPQNPENITAFCDIFSCAEHEAHTCAIEIIEAFLVPARNFYKGCSRELREMILFQPHRDVAVFFQGAPMTSESLANAIVFTDTPPSPLLQSQRDWIREKIFLSDAVWARRFVRWATERENLPMEGTIRLQATSGNLMAHTCFSIVDLPKALDNKPDLLAALDSVLDGSLNSI